MAEDRVRQLVAWQLKQIAARNRRSEQDRFREQEYFRMFQYSGEELSGYHDDNHNVGNAYVPKITSGMPSPIGDGLKFSLLSSRNSLFVDDDIEGCTEVRGSMPNIGHNGSSTNRSCFSSSCHSMPSGLHTLSSEDPGCSREGNSGDDTFAAKQTRQLPVSVETCFSPAGGFQRNFGVRRSRSFSGRANIRRKSEVEPPMELPRPKILHRREFYGSTPALSSHMISHMGWMDNAPFDGLLSPPPADNRPLSASSFSVPLSSWSSMSSVTGNRKIEEEVEGESKKTVILSKQKAFNENCCMRCFSRFLFLINQKVQCYQCQYFVCKNCSHYDNDRREYVCNVCKKQKELQNQSLNWFYDSVKNKFKRFGSAKVVRSLYKRRLDSDSETEIRHESSMYNSEPIGRRSRQGLHGLFEVDLDQTEKEITDDDDDDDVECKGDEEKKRCRSTYFSTPYSCSVGTGRETFDQVKEDELNTYKNHLPCVIQEIHRALDAYSPTMGEMHKQERNLLSEQKSQLTSLLLSLSQSLHIAVDNQDPTQNTSSPVAKHQLVSDILVSEVERFTGQPITLASVTKDGTQSCEEQLANIILNKIVDDYHRRVLQQVKDEELDVRRSFAKLSNHATIEQIKDRYVSESETDITSSQLDEPMSDVENQSMDRSYVADEQISRFTSPDMRSGGKKLTNHIQAGEDPNRDTMGIAEKHIRSPRDSDSGIVSSPTTEHAMSLRQPSEESEEHLPSHQVADRLRDWSADYSKKSTTDYRTSVDGDIMLGRPKSAKDDGTVAHDGPCESSFVESGEWDVITQTTVKDQNSNLSLGNIPSVPDEELDNIVTNNLINDEWSVIESRPSCVLSDDERDDEASAKSKSVQSVKAASREIVSSSTSGDVNSRLVQMKDGINKTGSIPISRQEHSEEIGSLTDSDVTIGETKTSPEGSPTGRHQIQKNLHSQDGDDDDADDDNEDEFEDESFEPSSDRVHVPLPNFSASHRLSFESGDLDDISSFHCNDDEDNASTFSTEISFGRTWNFSGTERLFRDSGKISAYDNFGEKKVGRDIEGPVIMLVPDGRGQSNTVKVGDRDLDELSDLSENTTHSNVSPAEESDDLGEDEDVHDEDPSEFMDKRRRGTNEDWKSLSTLTAKQKSTSRVPNSNSVRHQFEAKSDTGPSSSERTFSNDSKIAEAMTTITAEKLLALEVISTEKEENDPRFLLRPTDVTVVEGEVATFCCRLSGTEPIDVFWHKEGQDIIQLNDDDSCETRYDDSTYYLDIYNTRRSDQSQILCIGVNDSGRCVQGVRLFVQENPGDKKAPEFLKPLRDVDVKVGSRVKFRVKLSGYPQPKVNWYKDGKKLKSSQQCKLEKHGNRDYLLCINYATLDDDAEYTIVARNIIGEARSSAQLVVDEGGSDVEFSSLSSSRISLPLSPPPVQTTPLDLCSSDNFSGLYPDTEELLKLADKVSQTRGNVTTTATKMLRSAGQMSTLHQQLDEMDRKLNVMETEVKDADHVSMDTNAYKELYREQILQEHQEMQTSASAVRNITSAAINLLQSTSDIIESNKEPQGLKRKSELISIPSSVDKEQELVELKLTFLEFEKLYSVGKITREQMRSGMVPRSVYEMCMNYLSAEADFTKQTEKSHDLVLHDLPSSVDCGLKRVDSKRYKRDYIINKEKMSIRQKVLDKRQTSGFGASDIIKSTPAGVREDPHEKISEAQEQIYLAAGRVSHLQEKIEHLEDKVMAAGDDSISDLEDQVAKTSAQVKSSEQKVSLVEQQIRALESLSKKVENEPVKLKQRTSSLTRDQSSASSQSESQAKATSGDGSRQRVTREIKLKPLVMPASSGQSPPPISLTDVTTDMRASHIPSDDAKTKSIAANTSSVGITNRPAATETLPTAAKAPSTSVSTPPVVRTPEPVTPPPKSKSESIDLRGESSEDVLPESRTETEPSFSLPSVKSLKSKFDQSSASGVDKDGGSNFKRVYSLTGRDLPKTVRERLKAQGASKAINPNIRHTDRNQPQSLLSVFERSDGDLNEPRSSTPIMNASKNEVSVQDETVKSSASLNLSHVSNIDTQSPSQSESKMNASTKVSSKMHSSQADDALQTPTAPTSPTGRKLNRQMSSTILARAAFWDSRINQEVVSDTQADVEKFPQMPVENFKSMNNTL